MRQAMVELHQPKQFTGAGIDIRDRQTTGEALTACVPGGLAAGTGPALDGLLEDVPELESKGFSVWWDWDLIGGSNYRAEIRNVIKWILSR